MTRRRVLVVENDDAIRTLLTLVLEIEEYDVRGAGNGAEALAVEPEWRPDVILLDLMMPVVDGREFLARRRAVEHLASAPVILVTAHNETVPADVRLVVRAVVPKPHDVQKLLGIVEQALSERAAV